MLPPCASIHTKPLTIRPVRPHASLFGSLWSSWLWCDAPRTGPPPSQVTAARLGDSPHDMPCSTKNMMMQTNIVDMVQVRAFYLPPLFEQWGKIPTLCT